MKKLHSIFTLFFLFTCVLQAQETAVEIAETNSRIQNQRISETDVITNEEHLPNFLTDFRNGARFYKVNYYPALEDLTKVILIKADLNFLGGLVEIEGKKEIWLNNMLLQYPYLYKMIFYRQMGKLYGLEEQEGGSLVNVMTDRWELNPRFESYAFNLSQNHSWKKNFFNQLNKKYPLEKEL